ncbi:hypothetical protein ACIP8U_19715 [Streptomyces pseudovenezuelae]|uniref:hypothetical protein n=1 Tax=Streptomyces pseudovenezuelae TaxID=67350 RepID=UPI0037F22DEC
MSIERVAVFRFHRDPLISRVRVGLLRRLNPGVSVHGIFGGGGGVREAACRATGRRLLGLDTLYCSPRDGHWNWKNGDLVLLDWYREQGHRLSFDVLHLVEWDLLLTEPLDRLYASVPPEAVGLTALTPLSVIGGDWRWLAGRDEAREWRELLGYARTAFGYDGTPYGCLGVGPCFPRAFLHDYAAADPPDLGNDELRYPLFAQLLGHPVADTGFRHAWHSAVDDRYFNAVGASVDPDTVSAELAAPDGRRAFHPARASFRGLRLPAAGPSGAGGRPENN